jgi:ribosome biogenesis GTPase
VVGDWAAVEVDEDGAALVALLPRQGTISRRDPARRDVEQVVVANVDLVLLVFGLDRPLRPGRLERARALVHAGGARPMVVLSKTDLAKDRARALEVVAGAAPDLALVEVSAATGQGLDDLAAALATAGTAVMVGESGAGKSTLVNVMVGESRQEVAEVRAVDRKGRHTTTGRELFPLPGGGAVIDTPGLRALGLWDDQGVEEAFPDIEQLGAACRFRNCSHRDEPGCAVTAAVAAGGLDPERLRRYQVLQDEVAALEWRRLERERRRPDRRHPGRRR